MIALIQRVAHANVVVDGNTTGEINQGILVLLAVEPDDTLEKTKRLAERVAKYRIFEDDQGKMNLNVSQIGGDILTVSQFTLAADTGRGNRPSFSRSAPPELGKSLYVEFVNHLKTLGFSAPTGIFGADMKVSLLNDGPVTFTLTI